MDKLLAPIYSFLACETPQAWIDEAKKPENLSALLIDHCNCELKAAQTAMFMIRKYAIDVESAAALTAWSAPYQAFVYQDSRDAKAFLARDVKKNDISSELSVSGKLAIGEDLLTKMVRLIKEEFHHFEQVLELMDKRDIEYQNIRAGNYAKGLMVHVRTHEPLTLIDKLIVGAFIEARSCERFAKLAPYLDDELGRFYVSLLRSEARHYQDYLSLASDIIRAGVNTHAKSHVAITEADLQQRIAFFAAIEAKLIQNPDNEFRFHSGVPC
ncbi:tRNA isopentenyl-2-thiomethyl-A-37 hydroxylase MiaE [Shewanella sp. SR44-3]|uniref:tRNA isopentenyl-2-thiomethyl-A-37 hydroxylase MiaE n=1 Tax=Shewanella sp. SR44-3 TaxID=2760936 RepID=UPI0015F87262|nr:tRNA isopentenyl-2-thiomethyl-A-37 hydroxylase MiaE [Shewanella sp. SR44-3]MBB1270606.1 tRNA-(ms[2]io[6]A)-hydroxylase [Shewanella sp. SR44-3]